MAVSNILRPSGVEFRIAPSQLSTTSTDLCLACFKRMIFESTLSVSEPRRSWNSLFQFAFEDLPDMESMTSSIQGNCVRSLTGETRVEVYTLCESRIAYRISS